MVVGTRWLYRVSVHGAFDHARGVDRPNSSDIEPITAGPFVSVDRRLGFQHSQEVDAYLGLTPLRYQSGGVGKDQPLP
jgi:transposase